LDSLSVNQWAALNRLLFLYKAVGVAVAGICLVLGIACAMLARRTPIVIEKSESDVVYFSARQAPISLTETDIKIFVEKFIRRFYSWKDLNPESVLTSVGPLTTESFRENAITELKVKKEKVFVGKKIDESVAGVDVQVSKDATIALFDAVLRVEGVPLIVPMQVAVQLVRGAATEWNPMGLYVNSLTEHEGK
jgi:hypothetical protein